MLNNLVKISKVQRILLPFIIFEFLVTQYPNFTSLGQFFHIGVITLVTRKVNHCGSTGSSGHMYPLLPCFSDHLLVLDQAQAGLERQRNRSAWDICSALWLPLLFSNYLLFI